MTWRSYAGEQGKGLPNAKPHLILNMDIQGSVALRLLLRLNLFLSNPSIWRSVEALPPLYPAQLDIYIYIYLYIYLPIYFLKALYTKGRKRKGGSRREEQLLNGSICPSAGISYPVMATAMTATCSGQGTSLKMIDDHRPPSLSDLKFSVVTKGEKNFKK